MKIKRGSVTISITPCTVKSKGETYTYSRVRYHQDGKLHRPIFKTPPEALRFAEDKATELSNGRTAADQVSTEDAASIARIKQLLAQHGIQTPPELAIADFCRRHNLEQTRKTSPPFATLVTEFLAFKDLDGTRYRQRRDLKQRLAVLQQSISGTLDHLTTADFVTIFDGLQRKLKWENRTRNHYRAALSNLITWAQDAGKLDRAWKEFEYLPKLKERDEPIVIWTPEETAKLFAAAERHMRALIPTLVLTFFVGHRQSETTGTAKDNVRPIDWRDLNLETGEGFLEEGKVRSAGNRITHIPENAKRWLRDFQKKTGPVCPYQNLANQYRKLAKHAQLTWKHNAARRSYISYRLAMTRNLPQVSEETGTSIVTLQKRYRRPRPLTEAQKYFNIMPTVKGKRSGKIRQVDFRSQKRAKTGKPGHPKIRSKQHQTH